ncbi:large proline-rich protein bag6-B isoform X3 [Teleopsis dalmanni]|uniref:large proline-rich protein bag6-B isoform X3 n=1 Tax=Teleopsis dalmanni TaxID=139649 RepID=UPI0018CD378A|nr:large proline-rich protein bag6-B isoform X3 [Teleopsis dalmanni]
MLINLKVKTLDAQTHEFSVDNEITVREFKDKIAEKTNIAAEQQRIIYCGRVLADEKQLKTYDVEGKVVHVAERPPPSQRGPSTSSSQNNDVPRETRTATRGMRGSPLFRALDGLVVGTMAIPVNSNISNGQMRVNPFTSSSSFCMNRITVARHMLDCANNIANYLEDPQRGLNNTPLDILTRGRWTMESTVVEVGISAADLPTDPTQNIMEMVHGAVSAAMQRQERNPNNVENPAENNLTINTLPTTRLIIEDAHSEDDSPVDAEPNANGNAAEGASPTTPTENTDNANTATSNGGSTDTPRRTRTQVLAEVVEQMRRVQERLNPFIARFYTLLHEDPTFEENDTTGREEAQRLYDRVSEALHYMSHAQHAISDLMLDVSQATPRHLTCRPILVEQSGYVTSNNYIMASAAAQAAATARQQNANNTRNNRYRPASTSTLTTNNDSSSANNTENTGMGTAHVAIVPIPTNADNVVEDPVDEPIIEVMPPTQASSVNIEGQGNANNRTLTSANALSQLMQEYFNANVPGENAVHVQINAPNILAISTRPLDQQEELLTNNVSDTDQNDASSPTGANDSNATTTTGDQARVTTATLPTTSTQTRSTSRPQLQIGNLPQGRLMPYGMLSSFDRFLPCNSHHIRENTDNNANGGSSRSRGVAVTSRRPRRHIIARRSGNGSNIVSIRNMFPQTLTSIFHRNAATPTTTNAADNASQRNLRTQLLNFLNEFVFSGESINADTIPNAVNRAVTWFLGSLMYLPQYEKPEYDSRDSLSNILRRTLPVFFNLMNDNQLNLLEFEQRLKRLCEDIIKRLYSVLTVCVGESNAEQLWAQLMRLLLVPLRSKFRDEALQFLCVYINTAVPTTTDTVDAEQFLVLRNAPSNDVDVPIPMETDVDIIEINGTSSELANIVDDQACTENETPADPLPNVIVGTEPWHNTFPNEWLPVLTRDVQTQSETDNTQPPFSDAYISGMSAKRRKLIQTTKPSSETNALLADNVRNAITAVGVTSSTASNLPQSVDEITSSIASDATVQASFVEAVRTNVRDRLKKDPDYKPEKYPQTAKFINK